MAEYGIAAFRFWHVQRPSSRMLARAAKRGFVPENLVFEPRAAAKHPADMTFTDLKMSAVLIGLVALLVMQRAGPARADGGPDGDFGLVFRNLLAFTPSSLVSRTFFCHMSLNLTIIDARYLHKTPTYMHMVAECIVHAHWTVLKMLRQWRPRTMTLLRVFSQKPSRNTLKELALTHSILPCV